MRQLRVVGLGDDEGTVILEDPVRHERFVVASDERLRAAARGDVRRLGQMEIETASPLRPRDIQARVRAGEPPEQVAQAAGVSTTHVERFAYPVLLERARVAELAGRAHPTRDDRPDPRTLAEIVAATFAARGQEYEDATWDAWKADDGRWTVALAWRTGRSENVAHWAFRPGPSGGVVEPRDDAAHDVGGSAPPSGPRRSDGRAAAAPREDLPLDLLSEPEVVEAPAEEEIPVAVGSGVRPAAPSAGPDRSDRTDRRAAVRGRASRTVPDQRAAPARRAVPEARPTSTPATTSAPTPEAPPAPAAAAPAESGDDASRAGRKRHPIVPSWEDVLLGVRSPKA